MKKIQGKSILVRVSEDSSYRESTVLTIKGTKTANYNGWNGIVWRFSRKDRCAVCCLCCEITSVQVNLIKITVE